MSDSSSETEYVRISAGAIVVYYDEDGSEKAGLVREVDADRELIDVSGVPGVLRMKDIAAVGVYGDEAEFHLDPNGTGEERITRSPDTDTESDSDE